MPDRLAYSDDHNSSMEHLNVISENTEIIAQNSNWSAQCFLASFHTKEQNPVLNSVELFG